MGIEDFKNKKAEESEVSQEKAKKVMMVIGALVLIWIAWIFLSSDGCGCSQQDIIDISKQLNLSHAEAKKVCCEWDSYED